MSATEDSPIAVFATGHPDKPFNVVFANTVFTQRAIREGEPGFVGVFDGGMSISEVKRKLRRAEAFHSTDEKAA